MSSRIIDVNINRSREGLRVIEEIARFVLNDKKLTAQIKDLRNYFKSIDQKIFLRDSDSDVGRDSFPIEEGRRNDYFDIFKANIKRVEESLRVLEEFSKLETDKSYAKKFKEIRFKLYSIEKKMHAKIIRKRASLRLDFNLYVVTDPKAGLGRSHIEQVRQAIAGGAKIVQLRDKYATKKEYLDLAKKIRSITDKAGVTFIVNDHIDICQAVDADGIHLGQDDIPIPIARKILGAEKIIGFSTHDLKQALSAAKQNPDYISFGPLFETMSKPGVIPRGLKLFKKILSRVNIPVVAIGGINKLNIDSVIKLNNRIAVIRATIGQKDIKKAVRDLLKKF